MGGSTTPEQQTTRRGRRSAERLDRDAARRGRRARANRASRRGVGTVPIMLAAGLAGIGIVAFVAVQQLGGSAADGFTDPGIEVPAGLVSDRALGSPTAPVTLEVWEDFQCPVCARHSLTVEPALIGRYVATGTLRIVHRDLAFLGRGDPDESEAAASGAVCAARQDRYWGYAHWIYANQDGENRGGFRPERVKAIASAAGLDVGGWDTCVADPAVLEEVRASTAEGVGRGVASTPTMFLNGQLVDPPGLRPADELGQRIEAAAEAAAAGTASPAP